jgi:hypothetical protein
VLTAQNREFEAQSALKLLVQIADGTPAFLQPHINLVVDTMFAIANATGLEEGKCTTHT